MANSTVALAYHALGGPWNSSAIHHVLISGYEYYLQSRRDEAFLQVDELRDSVQVRGEQLSLLERGDVVHREGEFPKSPTEMVMAVAYLCELLQDCAAHAPPMGGFLFTGCHRTVAFWFQGGSAYLFNPHAVGEAGSCLPCGEARTSRLFKCDDVQSLAGLLLVDSPLDGRWRPYTIDRLVFGRGGGATTFHPQNEVSVSVGAVSRDVDPSAQNAGAYSIRVSDDESDVPLSSRLRKHPAAPLESDDDVPLARRSLISLRACTRTGRKHPSRTAKRKHVRQASPLHASPDESDVPLCRRANLKKRKRKHTKNNAKSTIPSLTLPFNSSPHLSLLPESGTVSPSISSGNLPVGPPKNMGRPKKVQMGRPKGVAPPSSAAERQARFRASQSEAPQPSHAERQARYRADNPLMNKLRHLSADIKCRIGRHGPAGFWSGELLDHVVPHSLKKGNLYETDIFMCRHCQSRLFDEEKDREMWCCGKGMYNVLDLPPLTAEFYHHPDFLNRARAYNDLFAFCAMRVSGGYRHPSGLAFFKIEGRLYHQIFNINANGQSFRATSEQQFINHCRLYLDDGEERRLLAEGRRLNLAVIDAVSALMANNIFARQFRRLADEPAFDARLDFQLNSRATVGPVLGDRNAGLEVHGVLATDESLHGGPRMLTVWKQGEERPSYLDVMCDLMEPFQYPLLYPAGTRGWCVGMRDKAGRKLTQLKYTRCLLLSEPRFSELGRLSQAWQVEMFCRYEEERLRFISRCQRGTANHLGVRVAPLDELEGHVSRGGNVNQEIAIDETIQGEGGRLAGKIYLPCSFTGGPRYMKRQYLNAMGLVSRLGSPTYFITFTASGKWAELRASTRLGGKCDPATCCRIFHIKLQELLRDLRSGAVFGAPAFIIHVIEMQMRGLPHAHIALRVLDGGPSQGRDIDRVIRADIPGPEEAGGELRDLVLKHMLHGPCGVDVRRNPPCWDDAKKICSKYFPKQHNPSTYIDDRGFVIFKRDHSNKACFPNSNRETHDGWVVPFNPFLILKYKCHINVEVASTRRVVKYLFKYLHKGGSLQNVRVLPIHQQVDEPEEYATRRMVGASDACWRLLGYDLTASEPSVDMLSVHLEGQQSVFFAPGREAEAVAGSTSKLLLYMSRPQHNVFNSTTYQSFYENFILHTKRPTSGTVYDHPDGKHFLTPRQRGQKVTRLFWVSPKQGELFYLRVLLSSFPCRGYADLLTRGGEDCTTFQEVARRLGLVNNEREYLDALVEAAQFMVGPQLRAFFVVLCNVGAPAAILWDVHKDMLSEDHLERHPGDPERGHRLALIDIDRALRRSGSRLADQGLPVVHDDTTELGREILMYSEGVQRRFVDEWESRLSEEQALVLEHVRALLASPPERRGPIFLDGPGGYGKTLLLKVLSSHVRSLGKVVLCVASSGIAALNMDGGTTAHNMFRLPLDLGAGVGTWNITNGSQRAQLVSAAELIIFDEAPMAHRHCFEMLDRSLQDLMGNRLPFGGKLFLCSGDFRQIPPVVPKARTPFDVVSTSLRFSELWPLFKVFKLTVPQRTRGAAEYSAFLLRVGEGKVREVTFGEGRDQEKLIPLEGIEREPDLQGMVLRVFPTHDLSDPDRCAMRAILAPLTRNVREINNIILDALPGELRELRSFDDVADEGDDSIDVDLDTLHEARSQGVPDHVLALKVGAVCLIMRNLHVDQGLVNGSKVVIQAISPHLIRVRRAGGAESFGIPRIIFKFPVVEGSPLIMTRRQFPLQLAYAMSFHKSQGQTIDQVALDLRTACFTHGQLYVGLSRVRSPRHIRVLVPEDRVQDGVAHTANVVYRSLLD